MMTVGRTFWLPGTGATFRVLETSADGTRGIAAGFRTGGRILIAEGPAGYYARSVRDDGASGTLLDTLTPYGPRYAARPS
jgi:hypothetical protein